MRQKDKEWKNKTSSRTPQRGDIHQISYQIFGRDISWKISKANTFSVMSGFHYFSSLPFIPFICRYGFNLRIGDIVWVWNERDKNKQRRTKSIWNDNEKKKSILSYDVSFLLNKQRKIKFILEYKLYWNDFLSVFVAPDSLRFWEVCR